MSFHNDGGRYSVHRHRPPLLPAIGINSRPPAIMSVDEETKIAKVCAWHHPRPYAKKWGDAWAVANGFTTSHGICPVCHAKELASHAPGH
jgi:hypothetical protein